MNKFKISMEDDAGMLNPEIVAAIVEIPKTQVDVAVAASEVAMQSSDVSSCISDIQTGQNDIVTLSEIQDVLVEASSKTEGIDETTAVITQIAVEAIYARLGLVVKPIPAMETFASIHSRKIATNVAIEGIGDSIKRIWQAILNSLKKVWEKIQGFVKSFKENTETLDKRLKQLKVEAASVDKSKMDTVSNMLSKPVPGFFRLEESDYKTAMAFLDSVDFTIKLAKTLSAITEKAVNSDFAILKDGDLLDEQVFKVVTQTFNSKLHLENGTELLFGNFVDGSYFKIDKLTSTISLNAHKGKAPDGTECLSAKFIDAVLTDIGESLSLLNEFNKLMHEQEKVNKATQKAVEGFINAQVDEEFAKNIKACINVSNFIVTTAPSVTFRTIKVLIDYVDASIKHFQ